MTLDDQARRSRKADFLLTAAHTLRHYGRPELGDELADLAGLFDR